MAEGPDTDNPGFPEATPDFRLGDDCDILIEYHDGTDDFPSQGWTLGGPSPPYWYLGVRYTPPEGEYLVQKTLFFSEFWVTPGNVEIRCYELDDPTNTTSENVFIGASGNFDVTFTTPICVDSDYGIVFCPDPSVWGVLGEDGSASGRSYQNNTDVGGCELINIRTGAELMVSSCVTPCEPTPTTESTWGKIKSLYR
jgi:hypothetical protein